MKKFNIILFITIVLGTLSFIQATDSGHKGTMIVEAKVIEKPFFNKIGREGSFKDYYIEVKQHTYFIKWSESNITKYELEPYLNKKVGLKIAIREGLWDTDDPKVQSRVGEYVAILKLVKTDSE